MKTPKKRKLASATFFALFIGIFLIGAFVVIQPEITRATPNPTPYIESWGEQIIFNGPGGTKGCFPGICRTHNGTLVAFMKNGTGESNVKCYYKRSWDNGTTWEATQTLLWDVDHDAECWCDFTCPNGDVIAMMTPVPYYDGGNPQLYRSQDNGSNWVYWRTMTELGSIRFYGVLIYNKVIYGFYQDPSVGTTAKICRSFDNASSFSHWVTVETRGSNEWFALPLNDTGFWRTIHRDAHGWENWNRYTDNNWSSISDITEDNPSTYGQNRGCNLWWLDDQVIVAQVEQGATNCDSNPDSSGPHFYCSWDYMVSWHNETKMGEECTSVGGNAYGFGVPLAKDTFGRSGLGGIGYMVYTEDSNSYVKGRWIANNRSQEWTWPPGPDDSGTLYYWETIEEEPPEANFTYIPSNPNILDIIHFTDLSSKPDGTIVSWFWDFGDSNTSTEQHPIKFYSQGGIFIVNLSVTDNDGLTGKISKNIFINTWPIAVYTYDPLNPYTNEQISFTDKSIDSHGPIVSWFWDFGDGNISKEQHPTHQCTDDGIYKIILNVTDEYGLTNETSQSIYISNVGPIADFIYLPNKPTELENVTFIDTSTDTDGYIASWLWDFGDGNTSTKQNPTHEYTDDGNYIVNLNVTDDDGETNETIQYIFVDVENVPPTANFSYLPHLPSINESIQFTDASIDLDGIIVFWFWDFGDGNISAEQNPQHIFSSFETYRLTLTVTDDDGDTHEKSTQIITKVVYKKEIKIGDNEIDFRDEADTSIFINATNSTNITLGICSGNPTGENISSNITSISKYIDVEFDNESSIIWPIDIKIYYTQDDLNNSNLNESQLLGIYFWNDTVKEWQLYNDTGVNMSYNQSGYEGYCWAHVYHLTPLILGGDNKSPTKVTGLTVTDAKDGKLDLSWNASTDNFAVAHYRIYRDVGFIKTVTGTSHQDTGLTNGQIYTYTVSAVDVSGNEGNNSESVSGTPTATDTGGGGGGYSPPIPSTNKPPIADAGGPYAGFPGEDIEFDGSESNDSDGDITGYKWDFDNDGSYDTEWLETPFSKHNYSSIGKYVVKLQVKDDKGATNIDDATVTIVKANNPPVNLTLEGPTTGRKNIDYTYSANATDSDTPDDMLRYIFNWSDGTNDTISEVVSSETVVEAVHNWSSYGIYEIAVYAKDNSSAQIMITLTVYIDVLVIDDGIQGYLIDENSDDVYELFHNDMTGNDITVEKKDNEYLIDIDGDGIWDYNFDLTTGLTIYKKEKKVEIPGFELIFVICAMVLVLIWWRRKNG